MKATMDNTMGKRTKNLDNMVAVCEPWYCTRRVFWVVEREREVGLLSKYRE
jgi:hypothetical protein